MALNNDGSLIATASEKGQVIRVFKTDNGQQLQELRRGSDQAHITALKFDLVSGHLTASSDKGTIHIFGVHKDFHLASRTAGEKGAVVVGLAEAQVVKANGMYGQDRFTDNPKSMFSFLKPLLPNYFMSEFSFSQFRIQDVHSVATVREDKFAVVVTRDGNYYVGEFGKDGGECKII